MGRYNNGGQTRADIGFETEEAWAAWEAQYHTFLMHYAHLAGEIDAAMLVVGTELANAARTRPAFWRRLIADVRAVYGGALTYAANWWEEYEDIAFWDALDYIGVQGYFELSKEDDPTLAMLREGWRPYKETMQRLSEQTAGQTRADIGFETEEAWAAWEAQYHTFLMHYAHLAGEIDAAMLVVGTELANAARTRPAFWRRLIADVRAVYGGALTYAANWWEEYEDIAPPQPGPPGRLARPEDHSQTPHLGGPLQQRRTDARRHRLRDGGGLGSVGGAVPYLFDALRPPRRRNRRGDAGGGDRTG